MTDSARERRRSVFDSKLVQMQGIVDNIHEEMPQYLAANEGLDDGIVSDSDAELHKGKLGMPQGLCQFCSCKITNSPDVKRNVSLMSTNLVPLNHLDSRSRVLPLKAFDLCSRLDKQASIDTSCSEIFCWEIRESLVLGGRRQEGAVSPKPALYCLALPSKSSLGAFSFTSISKCNFLRTLVCGFSRDRLPSGDLLLLQYPAI